MIAVQREAVLSLRFMFMIWFLWRLLPLDCSRVAQDPLQG